MQNCAVIIAAAGTGQRFGKSESKALAKLDSRPLFIRAIERFVNRDDVCQILLLMSPADLPHVKEKYGANLGFMGVQIAEGGAERWQTVKNGLEHLKEEAEYVAIHDVARICVSNDMIDRVFAEATKSGAAILGTPLTGTIKTVSAAGVIDKTVPREGLYEAQTPQVFRKDVLFKAYEAIEGGTQATDDAAVVEASGQAVTVVDSDLSNLKITYPGDLALAGAEFEEPAQTEEGRRTPWTVRGGAVVRGVRRL